MSLRLAFGSGLALGAAYLTRPEAMGIIVITGGLLLIRPADKKSFRLPALSLTLMLAGAAILAGPYMAVIGGFSQKKSFGDFVFLTSNSTTLAIAQGSPDFAHALLKTLDQLRAAMGTPAFVLVCVSWVAWMMKAFTKLAISRDLKDTPDKLGTFMLHAALLVITPIVIALEYKRGPRYISSRHMLLPAAFLAPAMGAGITIAIEATVFIVKRVKLPPKPKLTGFLWILGIAIVMLSACWPILHKGKSAPRKAGQIIRQSDPGRYFLAPDGWTPFYASAPKVQFQSNSKVGFLLNSKDISSLKKLKSKINRLSISYIVITSRFLHKNPDSKILEKLRKDDQFKEILSDETEPKYSLWVFTIINDQ